MSDAKSSALSVTTTAKKIGTAAGTSRRQLLVYPDATTTVYIGGPGVTGHTNGAPLAPGDPPFNVSAEWNGDGSAGLSFYAVTESGTATCPVLEISY